VTERFDRDEAAALRLDRAVDDVLAGGAPSGVDAAMGAVLDRLVQAHRSEPPPALAARVAAIVRRERRHWLRAQVAAAALAVLFLAQGLGNLLAGEWVARGLDVPFNSHSAIEAGILLLALGGVVLAGALERRWLDLAVLAGAPVGLAFAVHGSSELAEFPAGGVLHFSQGVAAVTLALLWWRVRRYVFAPAAKRGRES
jgi:hypothetical protein